MTMLLHGALEWLAAATGSYGWAIVLLTVVVRVALAPLQIWQRRAQAGTSAVQAELKEVQARSGGKLAAGCLPVLAQWPVLVAVYTAVSSFPFAVPTGFFWLTNLSAPDPYLVLPLLVVLTSAWQTWATVPKEQRMLVFALPLLMGLIVAKASAAVALYWLATNLLGLAQHYLTNRRLAAA